MTDTAPTLAPAPQPDLTPAPGKVIELRGGRSGGHLTFDPNQTALNPHQAAALAALNLDPNDAQTRPHLWVFIHMCQKRDLDPWAREAYLIKRGDGDRAKFTMQTGIDGYRKLSQATGRFVRVVGWYWTGSDDDETSWRWDAQEGVMRRVWWDMWPESRGYPGAARAVIEHYDDHGARIRTEATAHWSMYAPYIEVWDWQDTPNGRKRLPVRDENGQTKMVLTSMWEKGYHHQLAKCAEALAHRIAFPAGTSGLYVDEEMHRADAEARTAAQDAARAARATARSAASPPPAATPQQPPAAAPAEPSGDAPAEEVEGELLDSTEDRRAWLLAELDMQAGTLGTTPQKLARRWAVQHRKNPEDGTEEELLRLVLPQRDAWAARLREAGQVAQADTIQAAGGRALDVPGLFDSPPQAPAPHPYTDDDTGHRCATCGGFEDDLGAHPASAPPGP